MNGLLLHCGGSIKSRDEVFSVPLPEASDTYTPLSYESLVTRIEKQLLAERITVVDEKLALSNNGGRLFGLMQVVLPGITPEEYGCIIGFRNSYDKSFSTGLSIGAKVIVCDNLSFSGSELTFQRKHTRNLLRDLTWVLTETVSKLPTRFLEQSQSFERYRALRLTDIEAHHLIVQLYDSKALNVTEIPGLLKEWRNPRHSAFEKDGKTGWRLFNAFTETIKGDLWRLPQRTRLLHNVLDAECELRCVTTAQE